MRDRPNKNGIISIFKIPNYCTHCKKPVFPWDEIVYEPNIMLSYCFDCAEDETVPNQTGEWIHMYYSSIESDNINYNVYDIELFERFIWEKVKTD